MRQVLLGLLAVAVTVAAVPPATADTPPAHGTFTYRDNALGIETSSCTEVSLAGVARCDFGTFVVDESGPTKPTPGGGCAGDLPAVLTVRSPAFHDSDLVIPGRLVVADGVGVFAGRHDPGSPSTYFATAALQYSGTICALGGTPPETFIAGGYDFYFVLPI